MKESEREAQLRRLREEAFSSRPAVPKVQPVEPVGSALDRVRAAYAAKAAAERECRDSVAAARSDHTVREIASAAGVSHPAIVGLLKRLA